MRKIAMRDFIWMGKPKVWKKDYKSLTLTVEPQMKIPTGPLLLAVTDDDFTCSMNLSLTDGNVFTGVTIYHLETDYVAVGLSKEFLEMHIVIAGYANHSRLAVHTDENEILWTIKRTGSHASIGYRTSETAPITWVGSYHIPGIERSVSFGPYFSNEGTQPSTVSMHSLDYRKESR
ncbi:MAG: hypothetical protein AB7D92_08735 [Sphaerochaeta sp.]